MEEFKELVDEVLYEVREARAVFEFDDEFMGDILSIAEEIEPVMQQMQSTLADGNYEIKDEDLSFMPLVVNAPQYLIPYKTLLMVLTTHIETGSQSNRSKTSAHVIHTSCKR